MSGKGSKPRPYSVTQKQFANNWDNIFKKKSHDACGTDECCMQCDTAVPSAVDNAATVMAENAAKKG